MEGGTGEMTAMGLLVSTALLAAAPALAAPGGWSVAPSGDAKGCFLTRDFDRGTTLLLGLDRDGSNRLTVLNPDWSIAPRDRVALTYRFTRASFPDHASVGIAADGKRGFVTGFGRDFPTQFAASRDLAIFRGKVPVERLALDGSGAAVTRLRACVAGLKTAKPRTGDAIPRDPFAKKDRWRND